MIALSSESSSSPIRLRGALLGALLLTACSGDHPASIGDRALQASAKPVKVRKVDPPVGDQGQTIQELRVIGSGFDDGSVVSMHLPGSSDLDTKIEVSAAQFIDGDLLVTVKIDPEATVGKRDVQVITTQGRKGIGIEKFEVKGNKPLPATETLVTFSDNPTGSLRAFDGRDNKVVFGILAQRVEGEVELHFPTVGCVPDPASTPIAVQDNMKYNLANATLLDLYLDFQVNKKKVDDVGTPVTKAGDLILHGGNIGFEVAYCSRCRWPGTYTVSWTRSTVAGSLVDVVVFRGTVTATDWREPGPPNLHCPGSVMTMTITRP